MTGPSSTAAAKTQYNNGLIRALVVFAALTSIILLMWFLWLSQKDPYVSTTLKLEGSEQKGSQLFRINCAGCHGISAQGLVGPSLQDVSIRLNDAKLIKQVVSGKTPPMPSFQLEPKEMADILSYLHSLN